MAPLARFAHESKRLTSDVVKPKLFQPNRALEVSVFRIDDLEDEAVTEIGIGVVKDLPNGKKLYGWGAIERSQVTKVGLTVDDDDAPSRHSNIVDWPADKAKQLALQQQLASVAAPHLLNAPIEVESNHDQEKLQPFVKRLRHYAKRIVDDKNRNNCLTNIAGILRHQFSATERDIDELRVELLADPAGAESLIDSYLEARFR